MDPLQGTATPTPPLRAPAAPAWPREPRRLAAGRGAAWWGEGWRVFTAAPLLWIGMVVALVVIAMLLGLVPVIGALVHGVLWPVFFGGLLLGCYALSQGKPLEFSHLFAGFGEGRTVPLVIVGVLGLIASVVLAAIVMTIVFGAAGFSGMAGMMTGDPSVAMGSAMAGLGAAAIFAVPIAIVGYLLFMMAWWFAPALVSLNRADAIEAIKASFAASWKNIGALILFLLILLGLAILASIPFGLGWLVLAPVAAGAMFASWREVFGE
jgi:hypothetical protein